MFEPWVSWSVWKFAFGASTLIITAEGVSLQVAEEKGSEKSHFCHFGGLVLHQDLRMVLICVNSEDREQLGRHFTPLYLRVKHFP